MLICAVVCAGLTCTSAAVQRPAQSPRVTAALAARRHQPLGGELVPALNSARAWQRPTAAGLAAARRRLRPLPSDLRQLSNRTPQLPGT